MGKETQVEMYKEKLMSERTPRFFLVLLEGPECTAEMGLHHLVPRAGLTLGAGGLGDRDEASSSWGPGHTAGWSGSRAWRRL